MILLGPWDLALAALLILASALLTHTLRLVRTRTLLIAALRTVVQLLLVGVVLKLLFQNPKLVWVSLMAMLMLLLAGREVLVRQQRPLSGWWGFGLGTVTMFLSSFAVTLLALTAIIDPTPWYTPQYAIPLLGMLLGNTMTGIAVSLDRLTQSAWEQQSLIEARLMLGHSWSDAIGELRRNSVRGGLIPTINAMAAAGAISLPGMMTGQILAGVSPLEAVKYQIMIMFLISAGTVFGTVGATWLAARRLFDERQRLRLDRLANPR